MSTEVLPITDIKHSCTSSLFLLNTNFLFWLSFGQAVRLFILCISGGKFSVTLSQDYIIMPVGGDINCIYDFTQHIRSTKIEYYEHSIPI